MLARIVRDVDTQQLTWQRISGDAGAAGATPLGSVLAYFGTTVPEGFLPCNGATYDVTQYPELYAFLNSSTLPDLRECALVGIGENSTDTLGTHDIYTLGQFKDFATAGFSSAKTAGYTISGNSVILNSTVNASNRKLVTQYVADADATDLQNLQTSSDTVTRMRSKGVNWIIKAIPGMETTDVTDAIEAINEKLARALVTKDVLTLPTGADIEGYLYHYQGHYYVPHLDTESPTQSYLTELANLSDIQPVIEWLASTDPLPTGSAIKEHLYAQEYTTAGGDTKYHYYIGKVDTSDPLNNELVALETGAGASIFVGTQAEWDALTTAEKNEYQQANLTDVNSVVHVPVDVIADGNMNPVTSNAVYDAIAPIGTSITANPYSLPVTIPANNVASIGEITLTPGSWIVIASGWNFVDNPANILYVCLNSDWFMSSKPSNGWEVVGYYKTNVNTVIKVNAYNSTGSAMAVTGRNWGITAVRLA